MPARVWPTRPGSRGGGPDPARPHNCRTHAGPLATSHLISVVSLTIISKSLLLGGAVAAHCRARLPLRRSGFSDPRPPCFRIGAIAHEPVGSQPVACGHGTEGRGHGARPRRSRIGTPIRNPTRCRCLAGVMPRRAKAPPTGNQEREHSIRACDAPCKPRPSPRRCSPGFTTQSPGEVTPRCV